MKDLAKIDDTQADTLSNVIVEPKDVLLNITGASIARCSQVPVEVLPARVNQHVAILRPKPDLVDSRFLTYLLVSKKIKDSLLGIGDKAGATRQALTKSQLQSFPIPLPSLEVQQRIVAVLNEAFEGLAHARAHAEANLQNARELFKNCLSAFIERHRESWARTVLGEAYDVRDGTHDSPKYHSSGRALITSKNLGRDGLHFDKVKFISEEDFEAIRKRSEVHQGDVLFAMIGTIGNPIVVDVEPDFAIKNVALFKMKNERNGAFFALFAKVQTRCRQDAGRGKRNNTTVCWPWLLESIPCRASVTRGRACPR